MKRIIPLVLAVILFLPAVRTSCPAQDGIPRNMILLIGDGMGIGQLTAMKAMLGGMALDSFPVGGLVMTQSANRFVTESAAAGSALSTGVRCDNGMLAQSPDGTPLRTLIETALANGKATGVVSTSSVTHATPASFLTHVRDRELEFDIARQIAESRVDVLIGGGRRFFLPKGGGGAREDGKDLVAAVRDRGYAYAGDFGAEIPRHDRFFWLLADEALPAASARPYSLRQLVEAAIAPLARHDSGFVLMVEGSQIDWAAHDNDFGALRAELRDFDGAIAAALAFAGRDGGTLIVVTADHETGGLAVIGNAADGSDMEGRWISGDHTANMVPLFAIGPGATRFGGVRQNFEVGRMLQELLEPRVSGSRSRARSR